MNISTEDASWLFETLQSVKSLLEHPFFDRKRKIVRCLYHLSKRSRLPDQIHLNIKTIQIMIRGFEIDDSLQRLANIDNAYQSIVESEYYESALESLGFRSAQK